MNTNVAKPAKVAIIGASGTCGRGILARAEEIGLESLVVTRSIARARPSDSPRPGENRLDDYEHYEGAERMRARQCS